MFDFVVFSRGTPTCVFPSLQSYASQIHPSWRFRTIWGFRSLRRATKAPRLGGRSLFEKSNAKTFKDWVCVTEPLFTIATYNIAIFLIGNKYPHSFKQRVCRHILGKSKPFAYLCATSRAVLSARKTVCIHICL